MNGYGNLIYKTAHTKYGPVRYLDMGASNNKVVLFSTGGGASFMGAIAFEWICDAGYRVLSINRPGYYDLPVNAASSIEEQADIYHEVIKSLNIEDKINVFGISMGGLSALYYTSKYPTKSLVLWSAVTGKYQVNKESANSLLGRLVLKKSGKKLISWMLKTSAKLFPEMTIETFLKTEADLNKKERQKIAREIVQDPESKAEFMAFIASMTPMNDLYKGMMDEVNKVENLGEVDWTIITCPTYAIHSTIDIDVGMDHPKRLEEMIPNLKLEYVKAGGHFVWWGTEGKAVKKNTIQFLNEINMD
ncbi:alpha/beta fold hydrolase [Ulvibacterium sp.]|uniref:alpha/beta fold hydrolase n=1 Tax=Ulvibacterium sp. TaxID=2665914 RepID=UPI003BAC32F2